MRTGLIEEMRAVADVLSLRESTSAEAYGAKLLKEAADDLVDFQQREYLRSHNTGVFLQNDGLSENLEKINRERAKFGIPPI